MDELALQILFAIALSMYYDMQRYIDIVTSMIYWMAAMFLATFLAMLLVPTANESLQRP